MHFAALKCPFISFFDRIRFSFEFFGLQCTTHCSFEDLSTLPNIDHPWIFPSFLFHLISTTLLLVFMFHNFIFFPLKITRYWNSKRSYQQLGMLKIFSCSKITGSSSRFCYSFGYRFCYRGSRWALFLFLKCGSSLEGVPTLHRLESPWSLIWKPVVSRKLSSLWVGTSTSTHHSEKLLFSATQQFSMLRLPEMCLMYVKFWSWPSSQGELLSRSLVLGVPSLYLSPWKNSNPKSQ